VGLSKSSFFLRASSRKTHNFVINVTPDHCMDLSPYIQLLRNDDVVVIPTETVYGLAGSIQSEQALMKIFEIKQRPLTNPLIVHVADPADFRVYATTVPDEVYQLAQNFSPGPISFVLPAAASISPLIRGGQTTVALRIPNHPLTLQLIRELGMPLAAPSANRYMGLSATSAAVVELAMPELKGHILDGGRCSAGLESTIVGFEAGQPVLYRMGCITRQQIEEVLGKPVAYAGDTHSDAPRAPGMQQRHYAPRTPMVVTNRLHPTILDLSAVRLGVLSFHQPVDHPAIIAQEVLSPSADLSEAAHRLYDALHRLDLAQPDVIVAEWVPDEGLGQAINDKLRRGAESVLLS
jgi:L-threonylcarbamoyladenylate synthase